jgi:hypothetical protein
MLVRAYTVNNCCYLLNIFWKSFTAILIQHFTLTFLSKQTFWNSRYLTHIQYFRPIRIKIRDIMTIAYWLSELNSNLMNYNPYPGPHPTPTLYSAIDQRSARYSSLVTYIQTLPLHGAPGCRSAHWGTQKNTHLVLVTRTNLADSSGFLEEETCCWVSVFDSTYIYETHFLNAVGVT